MTERDDRPLAAEGDRTEQQRGLLEDPADLDEVTAVPEGVDPADARDQQQPVRYDEDDYR